MSAKAVGWALLAAGWILLYLCVLDKSAAVGGWIRRGAVLVPFCLGWGAAYAFYPVSAKLLLGSPTKPTRIGWTVILVLVAMGFGLYWLAQRT